MISFEELHAVFARDMNDHASYFDDLKEISIGWITKVKSELNRNPIFADTIVPDNFEILNEELNDCEHIEADIPSNSICKNDNMNENESQTNQTVNDPADNHSETPNKNRTSQLKFFDAADLRLSLDPLSILQIDDIHDNIQSYSIDASNFRKKWKAMVNETKSNSQKPTVMSNENISKT